MQEIDGIPSSSDWLDLTILMKVETFWGLSRWRLPWKDGDSREEYPMVLDDNFYMGNIKVIYDRLSAALFQCEQSNGFVSARQRLSISRPAFFGILRCPYHAALFQKP